MEYLVQISVHKGHSRDVYVCILQNEDDSGGVPIISLYWHQMVLSAAAAACGSSRSSHQVQYFLQVYSVACIDICYEDTCQQDVADECNLRQLNESELSMTGLYRNIKIINISYWKTGCYVQSLVNFHFVSSRGVKYCDMHVCLSQNRRC